MNDDVDDDRDPHLPQPREIPHGPPQASKQDPPLISRLLTFNTLAISSLGSFFSVPPSPNLGSFARGVSEPLGDRGDAGYAPDLESAREHDIMQDSDYVVKTSTPARAGSGSPLQSNNRFSNVKRIFSNFARTSQAPTCAIPGGKGSFTDPYEPCASSPHRPYPSGSSDSDALLTPPLTPDSFDTNALPAPALFDSPQDIDSDHGTKWAAELDDALQYPPSHSIEIREGKKAERSILYDPLTDDPPQNPTEHIPAAAHSTTRPTADHGGWYGLEYTLALSTRARRPSENQSPPAGEHSKSRESWAALHQGKVHPFFEDEEYGQWRSWHRYLDLRDERRRHRRGFEFRVRAKDRAWCYAEEMAARDVMYWQKEVYGVVARDVKERLATLAEKRPDPYYPPKAHSLGWYLKRSRSVACLRELRPIPQLAHWPHPHSNQDPTNPTEPNNPNN